MIAVHMVEVTVHQVVCVAAVWNGFVSAAWPVFVVFLVRSAIMVRGTRLRVSSTYADLVLVNMTSVCVVEVSIVKIVLMAVMFHRCRAAVRTMHVRVLFVNLMIAHLSSPGIRVKGVVGLREPRWHDQVFASKYP